MGKCRRRDKGSWKVFGKVRLTSGELLTMKRTFLVFEFESCGDVHEWQLVTRRKKTKKSENEAMKAHKTTTDRAQDMCVFLWNIDKRFAKYDSLRDVAHIQPQAVLLQVTQHWRKNDVAEDTGSRLFRPENGAKATVAVKRGLVVTSSTFQSERSLGNGCAWGPSHSYQRTSQTRSPRELRNEGWSSGRKRRISCRRGRLMTLSRVNAAEDAVGDIRSDEITTITPDAARAVNLERGRVRSQLVNKSKEHVEVEKI